MSSENGASDSESDVREPAEIFDDREVLSTVCVGDRHGHTSSIRRPNSPFAAAKDEVMESALDSLISNGDKPIRSGRTAEERQVLKRLLAKHAYQDLNWLDILSLMLTTAYPVKRVRDLRRANKFLQGHAHTDVSFQSETGRSSTREAKRPRSQHQEEGAMDVVPSAMHALPQCAPAAPRDRRQGSVHGPQSTVKEIAAQAVLFTRAFEEGYVDRLTTTLQQYSARRHHDYKTFSHETPLDDIPPSERLWAALERQTANNPHRRRLHAAVKLRRQLAGRSSREGPWFAAAKAHVIVFLQRIFHWWTPPRLQWVEAAAYTPWHTYILVLVTCVVFAFMAGEYPYWLEHTSTLDLLARRSWQGPQPPAGPRSLWRWLSESGTAWRMFHPMFLVAWGGTHPAGAAEIYRWLASIMVHADGLHLISNTFMFVVLATYVERRNGTLRTAVVFWTSAISGGLVSHSTSGNRCTVTVGSSGGVFGLLGMFMADLCLHFSSISYPAYRVFSLLIYAVLWMISTFRGGSTGINHTSHIIGLMVGGCWGSLFLPSLPAEVLELASPIIVLAACFGCLVIPVIQGVFDPSSTCHGSEPEAWSTFCTPPW
eukprot:jgi/Ulvmu1/7008/UM033_0067.1